MRICGLLLLVLITAAGCAGAALDPAQTSAVEAVPIPAAAESYGTEGLFRADYRVPRVRFEDLLAWYDRQLPDGQPWRDWNWCETGRPEPGQPRIVNKTYYYPPKPRLILSVIIADGKPPGILIERDDSGPCR